MIHWWNSLLGQSAIILVFIAASAAFAWYIESLLFGLNAEKQITNVDPANEPLTEQEFWITTLRKQRNLNWWTGLAASAATAAFLVLYLTLRENEKSFDASQRAYVGLGTKGGLIADFGPNLGSSKKPLLMVYVFNAGQSVARHLSVQVRAKLPGIFRSRHRFRYRNTRELLTQVPSNELDLATQTEHTELIFDPNVLWTWEELEHGDGFINGEIQYCDIFGAYHCDFFVARYMPSVGRFLTQGGEQVCGIAIADLQLLPVAPDATSQYVEIEPCEQPNESVIELARQLE